MGEGRGRVGRAKSSAPAHADCLGHTQQDGVPVQCSLRPAPLHAFFASSRISFFIAAPHANCRCTMPAPRSGSPIPRPVPVLSFPTLLPFLVLAIRSSGRVALTSPRGPFSPIPPLPAVVPLRFSQGRGGGPCVEAFGLCAPPFRSPPPYSKLSSRRPRHYDPASPPLLHVNELLLLFDACGVRPICLLICLYSPLCAASCRRADHSEEPMATETSGVCVCAARASTSGDESCPDGDRSSTGADGEASCASSERTQLDDKQPGVLLYT